MIAHFFASDWEHAVSSPFLDLVEDQMDQQQSQSGGNKSQNVKKVTVENNEHRFKMIVYREMKDGGIQGILLDYYIDTETGQIANEFLKIHEREDGSVDLIKIESDKIKLILDKDQIQKVFKQYFLKAE